MQASPYQVGARADYLGIMRHLRIVHLRRKLSRMVPRMALFYVVAIAIASSRSTTSIFFPAIPSTALVDGADRNDALLPSWSPSIFRWGARRLLLCHGVCQVLHRGARRILLRRRARQVFLFRRARRSCYVLAHDKGTSAAAAV